MKNLFYMLMVVTLLGFSCSDESQDPLIVTPEERGVIVLINAQFTDYVSCADFLDDCQSSSPFPWLCHTRFSCVTVRSGVQVHDNWTVTPQMNEHEFLLTIEFNGVENPLFPKLELTIRDDIFLTLEPVELNEEVAVYAASLTDTIRDDILRAGNVEASYDGYLVSSMSVIEDDVMY